MVDRRIDQILLEILPEQEPSDDETGTGNNKGKQNKNGGNIGSR